MWHHCNMLTKFCFICSTEFSVPAYRFEKALYCSRRCYGISERGRIPKSAFKKGIRSSPFTEFKPGKDHPYFGRSSPALGKHWKRTTESVQRAINKQKGIARPHVGGKNHWNWQGGITSEQKRRRNALEYRLWREAIFTRDDFTCQICGDRGVALQADHIKPFAHFPKLRLSLDNGRTLCTSCHSKTDTYKGRAHRHKPVK